MHIRSEMVWCRAPGLAATRRWAWACHESYAESAARASLWCKMRWKSRSEQALSACRSEPQSSRALSLRACGAALRMRLGWAPAGRSWPTADRPRLPGQARRPALDAGSLSVAHQGAWPTTCLLRRRCLWLAGHACGRSLVLGPQLPAGPHPAQLGRCLLPPPWQWVLPHWLRRRPQGASRLPVPAQASFCDCRPCMSASSGGWTGSHDAGAVGAVHAWHAGPGRQSAAHRCMPVQGRMAPTAA